MSSCKFSFLTALPGLGFLGRGGGGGIVPCVLDMLDRGFLSAILLMQKFQECVDLPVVGWRDELWDPARKKGKFNG